jgi:hypothetical protein
MKIQIGSCFHPFALACVLGILAATSARAFETGGDMSELTWVQNSQGVTFKDANGNAIDPIACSNGGGVMYWGTTCVTGSWGSESLFNYSTFRAEPAWGSL